MNKVEAWKIFFTENDLNSQQISLLLDYIENLYDKGVPIIFEYEHLALLMGFTSFSLSRVTINTSSSYRSFKLAKKSGGFRLINSPYPALAHAQKWIYHNILKSSDFGECSYAYCQGKNIVKNAQVHLGAKELLKMDIKDFFGSVNLERIIAVFKGFGYTNLLSFHMASICCHKGTLPQGACTSPSLSNIVAKRLDRRLNALASSLGLKYSRYADDITLSGDHIQDNIPGYIKGILLEEGFFINEKKTILKKNDSKKIVTGLLVSGDKVRVLKKYRREFRKDVHFFFKRLEDSFNDRVEVFDPIYVDRLIGRGNYILSVEPCNEFAHLSLKRLTDFKRSVQHENTSDEHDSS